MFYIEIVVSDVPVPHALCSNRAPDLIVNLTGMSALEVAMIMRNRGE
jgi:hypothetical protein